MIFDRDDFYKTVQNEDDVGRVIRTLIYIEKLLNYFLHFSFVSPNYFEKTDLTYKGRVYLAMALGLTPELGITLNAFGKFRNKFAHDLEAKIEKDSIDNLCNTLSPRGKRMMEQMLESVNMNRPEHLKQPPINQLNPSDKFTLFAVSVLNMLTAEIIPLENDNT